MCSYQLLKHQTELVVKFGDPNLPGRLIGDELRNGDR